MGIGAPQNFGVFRVIREIRGSSLNSTCRAGFQPAKGHYVGQDARPTICNFHFAIY